MPAAPPANGASAPCPSASRRCAGRPRRCPRIQPPSAPASRCRGRWTIARARPAPGCRRSPRAIDVRAEEIEQSRSVCRGRAAARHCRARQDRLEADASGHRRPSERGARWCAARDRLGRAPRRSLPPAGPPQPRRRSRRGSRAADRGIATAVDHLLDLDEEFDFANAATPALQVVARPDPRVLRKMVADPRRDLADFLDHAEIERAAPHERLDRVEKPLAERDIAGGGAGPDERRAFPRQCRRFVMRDGGVDRKRDRSDLRRRSEPEIDSFDIAIGGAPLQELDQPAPDPDRRLAGILAGRLGRVAGSNSSSRSTSDE